MIDIDHLLLLAKIQISDDEKKEIEKDLNHILNYVDNLKEVDTDNISAKKDKYLEKNIVRQDIVRHENSEDLLEYSPRRNDDFYSIPSVFK
ncbi:MAG: Asp-tRNA(Asn)/Glu-tRNA(Gln) amidotransferase subunit GatC [Candidatus Pacebacteria bacterium]|nr:Asp-tRNA(Asn)/Glu-tRNA(Gln) amidotransferase subunit GatC [Candidatus Paceibacterota bacterium]